MSQNIYTQKNEFSFRNVDSYSIKEYLKHFGITDSKFNYVRNFPLEIGGKKFMLYMPNFKNKERKFNFLENIKMLVDDTVILLYLSNRDFFANVGNNFFTDIIDCTVLKVLLRHQVKNAHGRFFLDITFYDLFEKVHKNINRRLEDKDKFIEDIKIRCEKNADRVRVKKEVHGNTKLTEEHIDIIKMWREEFRKTYREIAKEFNDCFYYNKALPEGTKRVKISKSGVEKILKK